MNFKGQKVKGCADCEDQEIKFGEFIIDSIDGDTLTGICTANYYSEDAVGEVFEFESYEVEPLDETQATPSLDLTIANMNSSSVTAGNNLKSFNSKDLLTLGII